MDTGTILLLFAPMLFLILASLINYLAHTSVFHSQVQAKPKPKSQAKNPKNRSSSQEKK